MLFNGLDAQAELPGHHLIGVTGHDESHHVLLALGQRTQLRRGDDARVFLFLTLAPVGDIATDRLIFDKFLPVVEERSVCPVDPGRSPVGANDLMIVLDDGVGDRESGELLLKSLAVLFEYVGHEAGAE